MNVNDTRELLWLAGGLYGLAFAIGLLKTFKINWTPFRESPLAAISLGFIFHTRHSIFEDWMYMVVHWEIRLKEFNSFFGH